MKVHKQQDGCSFSHQISDCKDHLQGGCNIKRCNTLRHRKVCKFFLSKEGCHRGDTCAYLHSNKDVEVEFEANESEIHEIEGVGPHKEVAVPERDLAAVDDKEFKEKEIETEFESQSFNLTGDNVESTRIESIEEAKDDGWLHCKICEYKCKRLTTFRKHMNKKHNLSCEVCGKVLESLDSLSVHKEKDCMEEESKKDTSFVFSESMLDEFL